MAWLGTAGFASGHPKNSQIASYWSAFGGRYPSSIATYSRRVFPSCPGLADAHAPAFTITTEHLESMAMVEG